MTDMVFVNKLLDLQFESLSVVELKAIANNNDIFKLNKEFVIKVGTLNKEDSILLKDISDDELRLGILRCLYDKFEDKFFVLSQLDKNVIEYSSVIVDFKNDLTNKLNKLDNYKLCIFIDKLGYYMSDYKLYIMGNLGMMQRGYHNINKVIGKTYGAAVAFDVFGKNNSNVWKRLRYSDFNKNEIIEYVSQSCIHHLYILNSILDVLGEATDEVLSKPATLANRMTRAIKKYRDIIDEEKNKLKKTGVKFEQSWIYSSDGLGMEAINED